MKFTLPISALALIGILAGSPVFAAPAAKSSAVNIQQSQFHGALDAYMEANQKLVERINNGEFDERAKHHLLSLVEGEKSELLTLRAKLFSTTDRKAIQSLAKSAKQIRERLKQQERNVILPMFQLVEFENSVIPKVQARIKAMTDTLTKSQYDRVEKTLAMIVTATTALHEKLLSDKPPTDASSQVRKLQSQIKDLYKELRSKVK